MSVHMFTHSWVAVTFAPKLLLFLTYY
jgi:hypothetical protein